jgi:hypothetical protein
MFSSTLFFQRKPSLRSIGTSIPLFRITSVLGDVPKIHRVAQSGEGGDVAALKFTFLQKNMSIAPNRLRAKFTTILVGLYFFALFGGLSC